MVSSSLVGANRTRQSMDWWQDAIINGMSYRHPRLQFALPFCRLSHAIAVLFTRGAHNFLPFGSAGIRSALLSRFLRCSVLLSGGRAFLRCLVSLYGRLAGLLAFGAFSIGFQDFAHAGIAAATTPILGSFVSRKLSEVFDLETARTRFHGSSYVKCTGQRKLCQVMTMGF